MSKLFEIIEKPLVGEWGSDDETGEGIPVLRTTNFTNNGTIDYSSVVTRIIDIKKAKEKYLNSGDIIIEKSGGSPAQPVGRVVLFEGEDNKFLFNNFTSVLRLKNKHVNFSKYLFYNLFSSYQRGGTRKFQNKTTGISNLKLDRFIKETEIDLPPFETQKHIAKTLDTASELLAMRKQQLTEQDNLIKSTFHDMFGDPITNEKRWEKETFRNLSIKFSDGPFGSNLKTSHYEKTGIRVIRLNNIGINKFLNEDAVYISQKHYEDVLKKHTCFPGDVVIGTMGEPNVRACIIPKYIEIAVNKADCILCRPNINKALPEYINAIINLPSFLSLGSNLFHGQTRTRVSMGQLATLEIPLPPLNLQNQFANIVTKIEEQKSLVKKAIDETQHLFDSLMSEYFE